MVGLFQEKTAFSGGLTEDQRKDPVANTNAYLNQLDKHRDGPGDIMDKLLATSVGGPMYTGGRAAMVPLMNAAQGLITPNAAPATSAPAAPPGQPASDGKIHPWTDNQGNPLPGNAPPAAPSGPPVIVPAPDTTTDTHNPDGSVGVILLMVVLCTSPHRLHLRRL